MLRSASNRYSVLREEVSDPTDLRIEMKTLQPPDKETEQTQMSEVGDVSSGNCVACLIAFGL